MAKVTRDEVYVVRDLRQLRGLRSPIRQQIISAMEQIQPCSVAELSGRVGLAPESLYYHVHQLVGLGLLVESATRPAGKRTESLYRLVAPRIEVDRANRSASYLSALADVARTVLRAAERHHLRALEYERKAGPGPRRATDLRQWTVRLSEPAAKRYRELLDGLDDFFNENNDPGATAAYSVTTVLSRLPPERS